MLLLVRGACVRNSSEKSSEVSACLSNFNLFGYIRILVSLALERLRFQFTNAIYSTPKNVYSVTKVYVTL